MDLKIMMGSALSPTETLVSKTDTPRELLTDNNVPFSDGQVTLNGANLGTSQMNQSLEELNVKDGDYLVAMSKHSNG